MKSYHGVWIVGFLIAVAIARLGHNEVLGLAWLVGSFVVGIGVGLLFG